MIPTTPPTVRILPMDSESDEFPGWSVEQVQATFFLGDLPSFPHPGRYRYRKQGLDAEPGTVVLFQFSAQIVASAILVWVERFPQPDGPYNGALWFDPDSIRIFHPVGADVIRRVWPEETFQGFGNARRQLDPPAQYLAFTLFLRGVAAPVLPGSGR